MPPEEGRPDPPETPEVPDGASPEGDEAPKLLMGKYKTPEDMEAAFREHQSATAKEKKALEERWAQLEAAGFSADDSNTVYTPAGWGQVPGDQAKGDDDDDEDNKTPTQAEVLKQIRDELAASREVTDLLTINASGSAKAECLKQIAQEQREAAEKSWEAKVRALPARSRLDARALTAVRRLVLGEILESAGVAGFTQASGVDVSGLAGSSERPGADDGGRRPRVIVTDEMRKVYDGLGGKEELGKSIEEYAAEVDRQVAENRRTA